MVSSFLIPDAHCLLLFLDLSAVLAVHPGPLALSLLLILLQENPSKLGDQGGGTGCHTPGMLLLNCLQQISGILITMGCRFLQVFQPFLPV